MSDSKSDSRGPSATRKSRGVAEWERTTLRDTLQRWPERGVEFSTVSSLPIKRLYGA